MLSTFVKNKTECGIHEKKKISNRQRSVPTTSGRGESAALGLFLVSIWPNCKFFCLVSKKIYMYKVNLKIHNFLCISA